jgi:hypothetical protein
MCGGGQSSGRRWPELGMSPGGREREEREWKGQTDLQVGQAGRVGCPRVRTVCPVDPNVNYIWDINRSGADSLSVWVAPLGALLPIFLSMWTYLDTRCPFG